VPSSSLVLYTNGIPIGAADLDFGNATTQPQLNALSSFSQMVNAIPSPGGVWVPTGSQVWSIYDLVLSMAEFGRQSQSAVAAADLSRSAVAGVAAPVPQPTAVRLAATLQGDGGSLIATAGHSVSSALRATGFRFASAAPDFAVTAVTRESAAPVVASAAAAMNLSGMFLQLKAQLAMDALTDTRGNAFYPTYVYPADFYTSAYDASWKSFQLTPGQNDPWAPVGSGEAVSGEMITVPLQRAWWSPWIFASRGWRFSPVSGLQALSDGGSPPQGLMPLYASLVIVARNIKTVAPAATAPLRAAAEFFKLRAAVAGSPAAVSDGTAAADPSGMIIIGFGCTALPKSPNPDPSLTW
jgi:hypothetical protein